MLRMWTTPSHFSGLAIRSTLDQGVDGWTRLFQASATTTKSVHFGGTVKAYRFLFTAAAAILCCGNMQASNIQGTILGVFSNPVLMGSIANSPSLGQLTVFDNTNTAIFGI